MRVLLSMLFVFLSVNAVAQNITGTVKDSQGEPIIGASVVEKGQVMEWLPILTVSSL